MARFIPNAAYDAYFAYFSACTRLDLVSDSTTPTDLTNTLANVTLNSGDYSVGAGDNDGRKLTVIDGGKSNIDVTGQNTTRHAVLSLGGTIRLATTCSERAVDNTAGDKVNLSAFYLNVNGPTAP